jgi:hypothetical protein
MAHQVCLTPAPVRLLLVDQKVARPLDTVRVLVCLACDMQRLEGKHGGIGKADTPGESAEVSPSYCVDRLTMIRTTIHLYAEHP